MITELSILLGILSILLYYRSVRSQDALKGIPEPPRHFLFGHTFSFSVRNAIQVFEEFGWKYGKIYKLEILGKNVVMVSDVDAIQKILKDRPKGFSRGKEIDGVFRALNSHGLFSEEGEEWKVSRQLVTPAFALNKVLDMREIIANKVLGLRSAMKQVAKQQQDLVNEFFKSEKELNSYDRSKLIPVQSKIYETTLRLILETAFLWKTATVVTESSVDKLGNLFAAFGDRMLDPLALWKYTSDKSVEEAIEETREIIQKSIENYMATNETDQNEGILKRTALQTFLSTQKENEDSKIQRISNEKMVGNLIQILLAGFETTGSSLNWVLYELARRPDIQKKIQEEVDSVIGSEEPTIEEIIQFDLTSFPYTLNVIKEALRLHSVAPYIVLHALEDHSILGFNIPKGTEVGLLLRNASLMEEKTPDPFSFRPERWEDLSPDEYKDIMNRFLTFGGGSRICPGRHLAYLEMLFIVVFVFSAFDISVFPQPPCAPPAMEITKFVCIVENNNLLFQERKVAT